MAYKTCVTVAEKSRDKMKEKVKHALGHSDYAEIRFDFMDPDFISIATDSVNRYMKRCVLTVRSKSQGGRFRGDEEERTAAIGSLSSYKPFLLDVEYESLKENEGLASRLKRSGADILVSHHDMLGTPAPDALRRTMENMRRFSKNIKIVTTAENVRDSTDVLSLYSHKPSGTNLIAFAMGEYGKMSRISSMQMGAPYTYVSMGKPVAPGQMSLAEIKPIIRHMRGYT